MFSICTLAKRTGAKVQTIRSYEQIGLLPEPERTGSGQRRYREADVHRLAFIRHARQLGFTLETLRELLELSDTPDRPCAEMDRIARHQLKEGEMRISRLAVLREELERMLDGCRNDTVADWRVLETLRDHAACQTDTRQATRPHSRACVGGQGR